MLRLNGDCLSSIFDHLRLRDQLRLTAVNEHFCDLILSVQWRSCFRRFVTCGDAEIEELSKEELQWLLKLIKDRIEQLVIIEKIDLIAYMPLPTVYQGFEFPVLRVLEMHIDANDVYMQWMVAHCPLIEVLYLQNDFIFDVFPYIVRMRQLRVLHLPYAMLEECELKQILTLPLTELSVNTFWDRDYKRSLAETLIGAGNLRIFRMHYHESTPDFMDSIVDLASTTELHAPLTVYIFFKIDNKITKHDESDEDNKDDEYYILRDEDHGILWHEIYISFRKYKRSLQQAIDNQLVNPTHTIIISKNKIEFRFFCPSNKK